MEIDTEVPTEHIDEGKGKGRADIPISPKETNPEVPVNRIDKGKGKGRTDIPNSPMATTVEVVEVPITHVDKGKGKSGTSKPVEPHDTSVDNFSDGGYESGDSDSTVVHLSSDNEDTDGADVEGTKPRVILITRLHAFELQQASLRRACAKLVMLNCEVVNCYIE